MGLSNPLSALRNVSGSAVTIGDLISNEVWSLDPDEPAQDAAVAMAVMAFDRAVLREDPIERYVLRSELEGSSGRVVELARTIQVSDCVERATPLSDLIRLLGRRDHLFVLEQDRVRSIVTHADLGASAVSMVVLAYILAFERACRALLAIEQVDVLSLLTDERVGAAKHIFKLRRRHDAEIELVDCLQFGDWRTAVRKSAPVYRRLGFASGQEVEDCTKRLEFYRNALAHGGSVLDGLDSRGITAVIKEVLDLFELTQRAWVEVDRSDGPWDAQAATIIDTDQGAITGPDAIDWHYSGTVHIVTACNPQGIARTDEMNDAANRKLAATLERRELTYAKVTGRSPDHGWSERSFLIEGVTRQEALDLGHLFSQLSIFELTGDWLRVLRCSDGEEMARVLRRR